MRSRGGASQSGGGGGLAGAIGGKILESIMGGGGGASSQASRASAAQARSAPSRGGQVGGVGGGLDQLLRGAQSHSQRRRAPQAQAAPPAASTPDRYDPRQADASQRTKLNDHASVLIRALINGAKADGRIDRQEQEQIMQQVGNVGQAEMDFLRSEFSKPLDVREFAWDVPMGMEEQVYTMSLVGMHLDDRTEAKYLRELAHGLRIDDETVRQIHSKYGAPQVV
ncbi:MAG: DUF533 domain-containing protein [Planctomycetota bacterium]